MEIMVNNQQVKELLVVSEWNHLLSIGREHAPETVIINLPSTM